MNAQFDSHAVAKVGNAMHELVMTDKPLRDRTINAWHTVLEAAGDKGSRGLEKEFDILHQCFASVKLGDTSKVAADEIERAARTIGEMFVKIGPKGFA